MMHYKVYLILVHKKPKQLGQLISILDDNRSLFFVHVDKKIDLNIFKNLNEFENCQLVKKRESGVWGGFGIVQGTLNGIVEIRDYMKHIHPDNPYHCIILSGEDLPMKSNEFLNQFFSNNLGNSFIPHWKLPYQYWWNGGMFRFENCYFFDYQKYKYLNRVVNKIVKKLKLKFLIPLSRLNKHFPNLELYGSSQWMILSHTLIEKLNTEKNEFKTLKRIFKTVLLPDETFLITYILNFLEIEVSRIKNQPTHLIQFKGNKNNPEYLSIIDLKLNNNQNLLFARKFDQHKNPESMDYLKNQIKS